MKKFILVVAGLAGIGCATAPKGVTPVQGFDVQRYLGVWHEIARLDHSFERGMVNVTAEYSLRPDGGVKVVNRGYRNGELKEATGRAYFTGDKTVGQLKVSFFRPFYGGYNIIELDKTDYSYALVAGPSTKYLWILARTPQLSPEITQRLLDRAKALGFPVDGIIYPK